MDVAYTIDASGRGQGSTGHQVPWWSFTKTLLAVASFRAAEAGLIGLDDPVGGSDRTLRQLLRHTAGLPDYGNWPDYHEAVAARREPWPPSVIVQRGVAAAGAPGDWMYSNIGYAMVGAVLTERTGRPLRELLSSFVLAPAGADSARMAETRGDLEHVLGVTPGYSPGWVYHGLVVGEPRDAARVIRAVVAGDLVDRSSLEEILHLTPLPQFRTSLWHEPAYGAGVMAPRLESGRQLVGHTGGGPGSSIAVYAVDTPTGTAAAAVFSDGGTDVERCAADLLDGLAPTEVA